MNKIFLTLLITLCSIAAATAQNVMRINKTDGTQLIINIDEIDNVDFPEGSELYLNYEKWFMHPGQTLHLTATNPDKNKDTTAQLQWSSDRTDICSIDASGTVTAHSQGTAHVTATIGNASGSITISVTNDKAFNITISDISNTACSYKIEPQNNKLRYYHNMRNTHGAYSIDTMDNYGSTEENLIHFTWDWYAFVAEQYGDRSWNDIMQLQLISGATSGNSKEFYDQLDPDTEYKLYAIAFDENGNLAAPIETCTFETTAPSHSDITFDISIDQCTSSDATFTIIPSNNDPYFVCVQKASYVEWFVERDRTLDMARELAAVYTTDARYPALQHGQKTLHATDFVNVASNEDYYVVVCGFNDGITSDVSIKHFYTQYGWTPPADDAPEILTTPDFPASVTPATCTIDAYDIYADENDQPVLSPIDTMEGYIGNDGTKIYLSGFIGKMSDYCIVGNYDAASQTLTFPYPQYVGNFDFWGTGAEKVYIVGGDTSTGKICDLTFHYDADKGTFTLAPNQWLIVNTDPYQINYEMALVNYQITLSTPLFNK